jgi:hypothetical protein
MSSKWITIFEVCLFALTAASYFIVAHKSKNTKGGKWAQILLIYANIGVLGVCRKLSAAMVFVFVAAVVLFNLNKAKRNERRNKRLIT